MKIEYIQIGDINYPKLYMEKVQPLGKYARMKLKYMKSYEYPVYFRLLCEGTLYEYLGRIDQEANTMHDALLTEYKASRNITEELKASNQMKWVQEMNNIESSIQEVILKSITNL